MRSFGSRVYFDLLFASSRPWPEASDLTFFALFSFRFPIVLERKVPFSTKIQIQMGLDLS